MDGFYASECWGFEALIVAKVVLRLQDLVELVYQLQTFLAAEGDEVYVGSLLHILLYCVQIPFNVLVHFAAYWKIL